MIFVKNYCNCPNCQTENCPAANNMPKQTTHRFVGPFSENVRQEVGIRCSALLARIEKMTNQNIQLLCGEMSRQELRTARSLLDWVAREMRANDPSSATGREQPNA